MLLQTSSSAGLWGLSQVGGMAIRFIQPIYLTLLSRKSVRAISHTRGYTYLGLPGNILHRKNLEKPYRKPKTQMPFSGEHLSFIPLPVVSFFANEKKKQ